MSVVVGVVDDINEPVRGPRATSRHRDEAVPGMRPPHHRDRTRSDHVSRDSPSGGAAAAAGAARLVSPGVARSPCSSLCGHIYRVLFAESVVAFSGDPVRVASSFRSPISIAVWPRALEKG